MRTRGGSTTVEATVVVCAVACAGIAGFALCGGAFARDIGGSTQTARAPAANVSAQAGVAEVVHAIHTADVAMREARPELVAAKYAKMSTDPFLFYRGAMAGFAHDWVEAAAGASDFAHDALVLSSGDAHPSNFGFLRGTDGVFRLEPNDLDTVGLYPYHWDLRRLTVGAELSLRERVSPSTAESTLKRMLSAYVSAFDGGDAAISTARSRGTRPLEAGNRVPTKYLTKEGKLLRGTVRTHVTESLSPEARAEVESFFAAYRGRFPDASQPGAVVDAVSLDGKGVSSLPVRRALILTERGAKGAPRIFEIKEATVRPTMNMFGAVGDHGEFATNLEARIQDAFLHPASGDDWRTVTDANGQGQLIRELHSGQTSIDLERAKPGSRAALERAATLLGSTLGQMHRRSKELAAHLAEIAKAPDAFVNEELRFAREYAAETLDAFAHFREKLPTP
ncbi:MAG: DUF2252 family protein [Myxococcales bacterium]|nr:DUF2252 family protein [Myxococcales bacterium]